MSKKNYEELIKKANSIMTWLPSFIARKYAVANEAQFGHVFSRHMAQSVEELKARSVKEHCSSVFFAKKEAVRTLIIQSLLDNNVIEDIAFWLVDEEAGDLLELTCSQKLPIGHGYINGIHYVSKDLRIVLLRKGPEDFCILTAFPTGKE